MGLGLGLSMRRSPASSTILLPFHCMTLSPSRSALDAGRPGLRRSTQLLSSSPTPMPSPHPVSVMVSVCASPLSLALMTQASRECARTGCTSLCCGRSRPVAGTSAISKIDMGCPARCSVHDFDLRVRQIPPPPDLAPQPTLALCPHPGLGRHRSTLY